MRATVCALLVPLVLLSACAQGRGAYTPTPQATPAATATEEPISAAQLLRNGGLDSDTGH